MVIALLPHTRALLFEFGFYVKKQQKRSKLKYLSPYKVLRKEKITGEAYLFIYDRKLCIDPPISKALSVRRSPNTTIGIMNLRIFFKFFL